MEEEEEELLPHTTFGHYEIHRRVGSGGMGDVYAAEHKALGKRVAIKVLRRKFADDAMVKARFIREGKLAARLRHPNIVDVTDVGEIDGLPCLVMELLEGEPLDEKVLREGALPEGDVVDLLLPIVAALDHAHGEGVLHRDLKPANVFLGRGWDGEVIPKLLDFGISKTIGESQTSALTNDTGILGTPRYVAPEVIGGQKATAKSDQYALGLVLYEASTGIKPFQDAGSSIVSIARAISSGDTRKPRELRSELSEAFERIIRRAMAVLPQDRFPSTRELGAALLPLASSRARAIWERVFEGAQPLETTGETNRPAGLPTPAEVVALRSPGGSSLGGLAVPASEPPATSHGTVRMPSTQKISEPSFRSAPAPMPGDAQNETQNQTVVMAHRVGPPTPRAGMHPMAFPMPTPPLPVPAAPRAAFPLAPVVVGAIALVGFVVLAVSVARKSAEHAATVSSASSVHAPAAPPALPTFDVVVRTAPADAALELDGTPAGTGALTRTFPRDGKRHVLSVSAPGHEPIALVFDETTPLPELITLRRLPEAAPRPRAAPAPQPRGTTHGGAGSRTDNINPWK